MTRSILLALALILTAGCAQERVDEFTLIGGTAEQRQAVLDAAAEWCTLGYCATFTGGESLLSLDGGDSPCGPNTVGCARRYSDGVSELWVDARLDYEGARMVAMHELGHHFGCRSESASKSDVMSGWDRGWTLDGPSAWDVACVANEWDDGI